MLLAHPPTRGRPRILGVFAHPDDEVFCAGGTLARWADAGAETLVVSATRGQAGQIRDPRAATRRTLGAVRERELGAACAHLGVAQTRCLDYMDGTLRDVAPARLVADVERIVRDAAPHAVITFGPDGGYGHPDHVAISAATTRACARLAAAPGGPAHPRLYYSQFPRQNLLLAEELARWLLEPGTRLQASAEAAHGLSLLAESATTLGMARDAVRVQWFPAGFAIVEQGEPGTSLYVILAGTVGLRQEGETGAPSSRRWLEEGAFFGERALAGGQPHDTSAIAGPGGATCLVLSATAPTAFAGRGAEARLAGTTRAVERTRSAETPTCVDVTPYVERKVAAMAAHRTQYPITPQSLPPALLRGLFGHEHFVEVPVAPSIRQRARGRTTVRPLVGTAAS
jgi:LmbE family N-acetylglucosaminyl deacetylase